jgi:hypothetical protein
MALELLLTVALASLLLHVARATVDNTTASCAPARCGDLSITYPFSLSGVQPPHCGFPALRLTCNDGRRAYLDRAFTQGPYRVQGISYDNNSLVVSVEASNFAGDETCSIPDFNVSSGLSRLPLMVSDANRNLTFVYNCEVPPSIRLPRPCANHTMGAYVSDGDGWTGGAPANCSFVSVPVRESHDGIEAVPERYEGLISDGFLLEWTAAGDCAACRRLSGAECRFVQQSFQCFCRHELLCSTTSQGNKS